MIHDPMSTPCSFEHAALLVITEILSSLASLTHGGHCGTRRVFELVWKSFEVVIIRMDARKEIMMEEFMTIDRKGDRAVVLVAHFRTSAGGTTEGVGLKGPHD